MFRKKKKGDLITFGQLERVIKMLHQNGYPGLYHEEDERMVYARVVVENELEWLLKWDGEYIFEVYVWKQEDGRGKRIGRMFGGEGDSLYWAYGEDAYVQKTVFYLVHAEEIVYRHKRLNVQNLIQEGDVDWKAPE